MPGPFASFCGGTVLPFEPCDELDDSIWSLEEPSVLSELLPELEEAKRCLYNGDKGVIR